MRLVTTAAVLFMTAQVALATRWQADTAADRPSSQEADTKQSATLKLAPVFSDDFSTDTRADYTITGDVSRTQGQLTLAAGASIERAVDGGSWATVTLRSEPVSLTTQESGRELRVWFRLNGATHCYVRLRRAFDGGRASHSIALVDTGEEDGKPFEYTVRSMTAGGAAPGEVRVEYLHGLVRVSASGRDVLIAHIDNGAATVDAIAIESVGADSALQLLAAAACRSEPGYTEAERLLIAQAEADDDEARRLYRGGKVTESIAAFERVAATHQSVFGEQHLNYAGSLDILGQIYTEIADYARAEQVLMQTLAIRRSLLGTQHPEYALSLTRLGLLYTTMGDYERAEPMHLESLETLQVALGKQDLNYASGLNNLAMVYFSMRDYARAEPLCRQVLEIRRSLLGEQHSDYAAALNNLAGVYNGMCDYVRAEQLYRQCIEIEKVTLGEQHHSFAVSVHNLATLLQENGDFVNAERLQRQALEIRKSVLGERHPSTALSMFHLGELYRETGDYDRAESFARQALEIRRAVLGKQHRSSAASLTSLARLYVAMGDDTRAERLYRECLEIEQKSVGELDPTYAATLGSLAELYRDRASHTQAATLYRQALAIQRHHINTNATVQSARQQTRNQAKLRTYLDRRVANALDVSTPDGAGVAVDVWQWKGAVTERQRAYRQLAGNRALADLFAEFQSVTRMLSVESNRIPTEPPETAAKTDRQAYQQARQAWETRVKELTEQREDLEKQIAGGSVEFRRLRDPLTPTFVAASLPGATAFIDFLEYAHVSPADAQGVQTSEPRYLAMVIRAGVPVQLVSIDASPVHESIKVYRELLTSEGKGRRQFADAARRLREELWLPLEQHLDGIETVIISPDTALGRLPFGALPGRTPGSYLLEQYRFASLPLAGMLRSLVDEGTPGRRPEKGLLVLGDVDYDANPAVAGRQPAADASPAWMRRAAPRDDSGRWESLPGFQQELAIVRDQFEKAFGAGVTTLRSAQATEAAFIEQAPRHYNLHVVTHGFFAAPDFEPMGTAAGDVNRSNSPNGLAANTTINQYLPGLLSGLVLAGANDPPPADDPQADGILTASEIETLNLNGVDLVVLSACETGLGKTAGGEGLTGLQRAFHVAGARSVVATLWDVDDTATQALMSRFYRNYWGEGRSKIDSLRQAQLDLLNDRSLTRGDPRDLKPKADAEGTKQRTHPRYWAAFVLSGDWR